MKNSLLKILFALLFIFFAIFSINAQEAIKFAEVTRLRCDLGEIFSLDDLGIKLIENPDYKGLIIVYGPQKGKAVRYINEIKRSFIYRRFPRPERISGYYGGFKENPLMELWIIPKGAKTPLINPITEYIDSTQFDEYTYEKNPYCGQTGNYALNVFANELKQNPTFKGYIIGYGVKEKFDSEPPVYLNQIKCKLLKNKLLLIKLGITNSRIKTIVGGYVDIYPHAELWIVPKGAKLPKPNSSVEK